MWVAGSTATASGLVPTGMVAITVPVFGSRPDTLITDTEFSQPGALLFGGPHTAEVPLAT